MELGGGSIEATAKQLLLPQTLRRSQPADTDLGLLASRRGGNVCDTCYRALANKHRRNKITEENEDIKAGKKMMRNKKVFEKQGWDQPLMLHSTPHSIKESMKKRAIYNKA